MIKICRSRGEGALASLLAGVGGNPPVDGREIMTRRSSSVRILGRGVFIRRRRFPSQSPTFPIADVPLPPQSPGAGIKHARVEATGEEGEVSAGAGFAVRREGFAHDRASAGEVCYPLSTVYAQRLAAPFRLNTNPPHASSRVRPHHSCRVRSD